MTTFAVDLRPYLPPIQDQGPRPTCLAFAVTGAHEFARNHALAGVLDLSEEAIYWRGRLLSGISGGMTFVAAAEALHSHGQPEEYYWPYDPSRDEDDSRYVPPPGALHPTQCFLADLERVDLSLDSVTATLEQGAVVVAGLVMSSPFFENTGGIIRMPTSDELIQQGHAVVLVGYADPTGADSDGYLVFRNSWGREWGDKGYGYLPYAYLTTYGTGAFVVRPLWQPPVGDTMLRES